MIKEMKIEQIQANKKKERKNEKWKTKKNRTNPATWRGKYRKEIFYLFW